MKDNKTSPKVPKFLKVLEVGGLYYLERSTPQMGASYYFCLFMGIRRWSLEATSRYDYYYGDFLCMESGRRLSVAHHTGAVEVNEVFE